ncbi:AcrB/AcrD/AcrF family protein [Psychromonas sp. MB-3u-54]|uniref:efflux RND transporter permease subunit n=1 Tax=Psychromonas sp. MB-3u-54 TaxID=2058319 RepID=UPI000C33405E|nr:efflux RND transporter permease subunit [Psychromonas sp. MB-3u-54]PKH04477.1 AcrB/AcrD/AcrF family protein [Psychromonas sp. MB-3u-54]
MIRFFARHPTLANLIMLSFFVLGLSSLNSLKRETFPEFTPPYIIATVIYPGASPAEVEESICLRMEDAIDGLSNIEETICDAQEGSASLRVKLGGDIDIGRSLVDIQTEINAIQDFPSQIEAPTVKELDWSEPVIDIAISADLSLPDLKAYAENVKHRLKVDADVSLVTLTGFSAHQIRVELNETAMRRLNLTVTEIANKIGRQNIKMPVGTIELPAKNLLIRFDERKLTPAKIGEIIISSNSEGAVVRLNDVATITDLFELEEAYTLFNGKPSAMLKIQKNKADDALRIKARVQAFVEHEQLVAPEGITLTLTNDLSSLLQDRLSMLLRNGAQGIVLVFFSMWLFFSFRYSFWVSAGLPVAFMGGLFVMSLFGISINVMTLVGLLMAIGIMMDDAIVIAESVAAHVERGFSVDQAVIKGVIKVAPGVISSFLTTIFIFGSLLWLDGQMGKVLSAVPMVLIIVLTISLIEAFLILPNHLRHSLNASINDQPPLKFKRIFLEKFEHFRIHSLVKMVTLVVKWRYASLGLTFGVLLISVALLAGGIVKFVPFPALDGDIAEARIILPPGSTLEQTQKTVEHIISAAKLVGSQYTQDNNEPSPLVRDITAQYNFNADAGEKGPHLATVRLDLLSAEIRHSLIEAFIEDWRLNSAELADPIAMVFKQPAMGPAGRDIEVRLQHNNLTILKTASVELQTYLHQFSGVNSILDDMRPGKEEILIKLKDGAENYGLDGKTVADQLRAAYFGQTADEIQAGAENIKIQVRLNKDQAANIQALGNFPIMLAGGKHIPLNAVATFDYERSFVRIQRIDSQRTITVMADVNNSKANASEIMNKVQRVFLPELLLKYPGLSINLEGASKESAKTANSFIKGFSIGLFGLFAILSFQFRSYLEPFVVMLAIPLALIGVFWGHWLTGHNLSMPSILGFVSLAGIVVNDSILLVQYIRHHVDIGENIYESVVKASRDRFRAVFLTSLTTAAGLLPLLLETSLQAQVVKPIVISIVFGIFASTLLVLFIIPSAYAVLADFGLVHKHQEFEEKIIEKKQKFLE